MEQQQPSTPAHPNVDGGIRRGSRNNRSRNNRSRNNRSRNNRSRNAGIRGRDARGYEGITPDAVAVASAARSTGVQGMFLFVGGTIKVVVASFKVLFGLYALG
uniref:Uncharacterized protein n=1 Tax=Panagrolaimus davidi TaxID=227884 RepID=A0A914PWF3_9BILA